MFMKKAWYKNDALNLWLIVIHIFYIIRALTDFRAEFHYISFWSSFQFGAKFISIIYTTQTTKSTRSTTINSINERPPTVNLLPENTAGGWKRTKCINPWDKKMSLVHNEQKTIKLGRIGNTIIINMKNACRMQGSTQK